MLVPVFLFFSALQNGDNIHVPVSLHIYTIRKCKLHRDGENCNGCFYRWTPTVTKIIRLIFRPSAKTLPENGKKWWMAREIANGCDEKMKSNFFFAFHSSALLAAACVLSVIEIAKYCHFKIS